MWKETMKLPCASHSQGPAGSETSVIPPPLPVPKLQLVREVHVESLFGHIQETVAVLRGGVEAMAEDRLE